MKLWGIAIILVVFFLSFASAQTLYNDLGNQTGNSGQHNIGSNNYATAFNFTASTNYDAEKIQVYVETITLDTGNINATIMYNNATVVPNGTVVNGFYTDTIDISTSMTAGNYYNFTFTNKPTLTKGESYWVVFTITDNAAGSWIRLGEGAGGNVEFRTSNDPSAQWGGTADLGGVNVKLFGEETIFVETILNAPTSDLYTVNTTLQFNSTINSGGQVDVRNATLYVWHQNNSVFNQDTNTITNTTNVPTWDVSNWNTLGNYTWNVYACGQNGTVEICDWGTNRTFLWGIKDVNTNLITPVYETETHNFNVSFNISTGVPTGNLWWNGTSYAGTATNLGSNNWRLSKSLTIPTGAGTKNTWWEINTGTLNYNSSLETQVVSTFNITICGADPQDVPYLNISFKSETDSTSMSALLDSSSWTYWIGDGTVTRTYTYSSPTLANATYTFCFSPPDRTVNVDLTFKYSNSSFPQRTYSLDDQALTNTTTQQVLYLLGTDDGIYSSINVIESTGTVISGVLVTSERQISDVWTTIGQATTGDDGLVTFWNNPNYAHRITASKTGYTSAQVTITPSQSLYTLTMQKTAGNASYTAPIPGLKWEVYPVSGVLTPGTYNFNATVTSSEGNLENCKFELISSSNLSNVLATNTAFTNSSYCYLTVSYAVIKDQNMFGRLSVDTTETDSFVIVYADWKWIIIDIDKKSWRTITSFFGDFKTIGEFGEGNEGEFSRIVLFFFFVTLFVGLFNYFSGAELSNPGMTLLIIWIIVVVASVGGFLTFESGSDNVTSLVEQFGFMIIFTISVIGYSLSMLRRAHE